MFLNLSPAIRACNETIPLMAAQFRMKITKALLQLTFFQHDIIWSDALKKAVTESRAFPVSYVQNPMYENAGEYTSGVLIQQSFVKHKYDCKAYRRLILVCKEA